MHVEMIDVLGDDLRVVNAARVSFDKASEWNLVEVFGEDEHGRYAEDKQELSMRDRKLVSYLARHNHFTPFTHVMITMRETVPIFVARQRFKHTVGFTYNEISRRYVDDAPTFFIPDVWRKRAENKKQGSSEESVEELRFQGFKMQSVQDGYEKLLHHCSTLYEDMIEAGVCPEQARMILPQSMYTSYYVTGSLAAWARAYNLRSKPDSQKEIQLLAGLWKSKIDKYEPLTYSWRSLIDHTS